MSERIALHEGAMEVSDAAGMTDASGVSHRVRFNEDLCLDLCVDLFHVR